jgi:translocator assembly and maintenance protein 41
MHKPVFVVKADEAAQAANEMNLGSALAAVLLLEQNPLTEQELFTELAGLSYHGDPRMGRAENPNKVRNIVSGALPQFSEYYNASRCVASIMKYTNHPHGFTGNANSLIVYNGPRDLLVEQLPPFFQRSARDGTLQNALRATVQRSAVQQSLKGVLSAGVMSSLRYLMQKRRKLKG